jgi:hypothetical protein
MKYIKLFESFLEREDVLVMMKILPVINDEWFIEGEDPPQEFIDQFNGLDIKDPLLQHMIETCTSGPGYTDIWIETGELISDVIDRNDVSADVGYIENSNKEWFSEERKEIKQQILSTITPNEINKKIKDSPEETVVWLKKVWKFPEFSEIRKKIIIPERLKKELETVSDLDDLGF